MGSGVICRDRCIMTFRKIPLPTGTEKVSAPNRRQPLNLERRSGIDGDRRYRFPQRANDAAARQQRASLSGSATSS
jgi:hypothetical protein